MAILGLPCLQSGSERSDVGHKVSRTKWSSTFPDTSSLGSFFVDKFGGRNCSMSLRDCLSRRGEAEVQVDSEIRRLKKLCQADAPSSRAIQARIQRLENARKEWVASNVAYVQKANSDLRSPDQLHYFNSKDEIIDEAIDAATATIGGSANNEEPEVNVEKLKEDCDLLQLQLESELAALKAAVAGEVNNEACADFLIKANELESNLMGMFRQSCSSLIAAVPEEERQALKTKHEAFIKRLVPEVKTLVVLIMSKKKSSTPSGASSENTHVENSSLTDNTRDPHGLYSRGAPIMGGKQFIDMKPLDLLLMVKPRVMHDSRRGFKS